MGDVRLRRSRRRGAGSPLVNVLAIAVIVVVLAMLLRPAYIGGPRIWMTAACMSNLKQCDLGLLIYSTDFDDRLPESQVWMDRTHPYVKNEAVFHCPAFIKTNPQAYGYAMGSTLSGKNAAKIAKPEGVPALFESVLVVRNAASGFYGLPDPPRHKNKDVVAFLDGHVRTFTPEQAAQIGRSPGSKRP